MSKWTRAVQLSTQPGRSDASSFSAAPVILGAAVRMLFLSVRRTHPCAVCGVQLCFCHVFCQYAVGLRGVQRVCSVHSCSYTCSHGSTRAPVPASLGPCAACSQPCSNRSVRCCCYSVPPAWHSTNDANCAGGPTLDSSCACGRTTHCRCARARASCSATGCRCSAAHAINWHCDSASASISLSSHHLCTSHRSHHFHRRRR